MVIRPVCLYSSGPEVKAKEADVLRGRRSIVLAGVVLVVAVAAPVLVLAADGRLGSRLDRQSAAWTTTAVSTSSTDWRNVPRLALTRCTRDQVTATVSVTVTGAPVFFRVVPDGVPEAPFKPGAARFVPNGVESFSYTFVGRTAPFEADDTHRFNVQWRSGDGSVVTLIRGDLNILFQRGSQGC
jgi:hypothetical protein